LIYARVLSKMRKIKKMIFYAKMALFENGLVRA